MDPVRNPFAPGAGTQPPELAGRSEVLDEADVALQRISAGLSAQSLVLVGLRGVGKTVLLVRVKQMAEARGHFARLVEAREDKPLAKLLTPVLQDALSRLNVVERAKDLVRHAYDVLRGFTRALTVKYGEIEYGLELGPAGSGDLEADLPELFGAVGRAAREAGRPVTLIIDEMQCLSEHEFSALIMAMHKVHQDGLPLMLFGAGLPHVLRRAGESKSYSERLFRFPEIGALLSNDAMVAIRKPLASEKVRISDDALEEVLQRTHRYPYFLQQWAYDCWNCAAGSEISMDDVRAATHVARATLDRDFFRVRIERCGEEERRYMAVLAALKGRNPSAGRPLAEVRGHLANLDDTAFDVVHDGLIAKGMTYMPTRERVAFTVPLFEDYLRRTQPKAH